MINRNPDENMLNAFSRNWNDTRSSRPQLGLQLFSPTRRYIVGKYTIADPSGNKPRFPEEKLTSGNIRGVGER